MPLATIDGHRVTVNGLSLVGLDEFGCYWRLTQNPNFHGSTGSSISSTQKSSAPGSWAGPRQYRERNLVVGGLVQCPTVEAAVSAVDRLTSAITLDEFRYEVQESDLLPPRYKKVTQGSDEVLVDFQSETLFQWSAHLIATDPRKWGADIVEQLPIGSITIVNPGNTAGTMIADLIGPLTHPRLNDEAGRVIEFANVSIPAGETWTVNMATEQVVSNTGVRHNGDLSRRGWMPFPAGDTTISLSAAGGTGRAVLTLTPAWK